MTNEGRPLSFTAVGYDAPLSGHGQAVVTRRQKRNRYTNAHRMAGPGKRTFRSRALPITSESSHIYVVNSSPISMILAPDWISLVKPTRVRNCFSSFSFSTNKFKHCFRFSNPTFLPTHEKWFLNFDFDDLVANDNLEQNKIKAHWLFQPR